MRQIALLIPCYNEEDVLADTLRSVFQVGMPAEDIFVIDDCSKDRTSEIARSHGVNVLRNKTNLGKTRGLEAAIKHFGLLNRYEYTSILDADTLVDPGYFAFVEDTFAKHPDVAVVCGQPMSIRRNWLTAWRAFEYALVHAIYKEGQNRMKAISISAGCASTYRTEVIAQIEWHPDRIIIEDADATPQVHRKRLGQIIYDKRAKVFTQDPHTLKSYIGQIRRWYTGIWQAWIVYRIPFGFQRLDFESLVLNGEVGIFSLLVTFLPLWLLFFPAGTVFALIVDQVFMLSMAVYFAVRLRRLDVAICSPLFVIPRYLNAVVYVTSFYHAIIRRERAGQWFKPERYLNQPATEVAEAVKEEGCRM